MTDSAIDVRFRYEAVNLDGENVKGIIEAPSALIARNRLAVQGVRVTKISEKKGLQMELTKEKVPLLEIMHFSRQMSTFIRSGIPILEALDTHDDVQNDYVGLSG